MGDRRQFDEMENVIGYCMNEGMEALYWPGLPYSW